MDERVGRKEGKTERGRKSWGKEERMARKKDGRHQARRKEIPTEDAGMQGQRQSTGPVAPGILPPLSSWRQRAEATCRPLEHVCS